MEVNGEVIPLYRHPAAVVAPVVDVRFSRGDINVCEALAHGDDIDDGQLQTWARSMAERLTAALGGRGER
jgi:hypothetical protein